MKGRGNNDENIYCTCVLEKIRSIDTDIKPQHLPLIFIGNFPNKIHLIENSLLLCTIRTEISGNLKQKLVICFGHISIKFQWACVKKDSKCFCFLFFGI